MRLYALLPIAALCAGATLAGCGGDDAPTAAPPATTALSLNFGLIDAIEDCDGIEGDGDFTFLVQVSQLRGKSDIVYSGSVSLGTGESLRMIAPRTYSMVVADPLELEVSFSARELDKPIIGADYNDTRLDNEIASVRHVFTNGSWTRLGDRTITLGSAGCRVALHYMASML